MVRKIGVLTSGGDAPGMNAAIRAVTRTALDKGWQVVGIRHGYSGLLGGEFVDMTARSVGGIIQQGGTMLGSARSPEFKTEEGRRKAIRNLSQHHIDGLIVIGGNGSQSGANALHEMGVPVNGVASTIDNDLLGSDITIGVDTALNVALEAVDRLKVTASSHQRAFLVEVMGRDCGYLALMAAIAGGAEGVVIPEIEATPQDVQQMIIRAYDRGKAHAIIIVAEGAKWDAQAMAAHFAQRQEFIGFELRATTLGHVQRGGAPLAYDRLLATRLAAGAVDALERGQSGVLVGTIGSKITATPLKDVAGKTKSIDPKLLELATRLANQ
jgi:6-phosphofructokinase 1